MQQKTSSEIVVTTKNYYWYRTVYFFFWCKFFFCTRPVLNQTTFFVVCFVTNLLTNFVTVIKHISFLKTGGFKNQICRLWINIFLYVNKKMSTLKLAICKSRNGESENKMKGMRGMGIGIRGIWVGMRGIRLEMRGIRLVMRGIGVRIRGIRVGMRGISLK